MKHCLVIGWELNWYYLIVLLNWTADSYSSHTFLSKTLSRWVCSDSLTLRSGLTYSEWTVLMWEMKFVNLWSRIRHGHMISVCSQMDGRNPASSFWITNPGDQTPRRIPPAIGAWSETTLPIRTTVRIWDAEVCSVTALCGLEVQTAGLRTVSPVHRRRPERARRALNRSLLGPGLQQPSGAQPAVPRTHQHDDDRPVRDHRGGELERGDCGGPKPGRTRNQVCRLNPMHARRIELKTLKARRPPKT